ncbi:hypothetical protein GCM10011495_26700 [Hymenobacter frigidus]|uniref:Uncharacterized protein n=1 Tax=Hymenobacter frigidus TaxID=1524095 RepID=A0ABQ2A9T7_9BACT|nr:hypothetical protein [Hymenobacter frigidus]GGH87543.1 hypothetical protein GCM10011495_26700 [Hymenobacter frigidus]
MEPETAFLVAILRQSPQGSVWRLSKDSWEELPHVLGPDLLQPDDAYWWHVRITAANRGRLLAVAEAYELPDKVVHMFLTTAQGRTFFRGEDHLDTIICDIGFQDLSRVCSKFPHLEQSIVKTEGEVVHLGWTV